MYILPGPKGEIVAYRELKIEKGDTLKTITTKSVASMVVAVKPIITKITIEDIKDIPEKIDELKDS